jgi:hypothetical protein
MPRSSSCAHLYTERLAESESPLTRTAALFGLYTFFATQPSTSAPPLHAHAHLPVTIGKPPLCVAARSSNLWDTDMYQSLLKLPDVLDTNFLRPLRLHVIYVLSALHKAQFFHILPPSNLFPFSPRELPREQFISDFADGNGQVAAATNAPKKKGRPSKHDKVKKSRDAAIALDKWLDKTAYTYQPPQAINDVAPQAITTHILLSHPPSTTRNNYRAKKSELLEKIEPDYPYVTEGKGRAALEQANRGVVSRLRKIDEEAAAKGMEIGGEGGERTGLRRVERAADELGKHGSVGGRGGLLGLLEGAGIGQENK